MPKYAPRNSVGQLPFYIVVWEWERETPGIYYAQNAPQARRFAVPETTNYVHVVSSRRATLEDLETISVRGE